MKLHQLIVVLFSEFYPGYLPPREDRGDDRREPDEVPQSGREEAGGKPAP